MKSLVDFINESVDNPMVDWIVDFWKNIKFEDINVDDRNKRLVCTDITDRSKIEHLLRDFAYDAKKKGRKSKCLNKRGDELVQSKEDKTLICIQYLRTGDIDHIGIGNMSQSDALCIESELVKIDGKEKLRLTCLCRDNCETYPYFLDIVKKYSMHRGKYDYYELPGDAYKIIKDTIVK